MITTKSRLDKLSPSEILEQFGELGVFSERYQREYAVEQTERDVAFYKLVSDYMAQESAA